MDDIRLRPVRSPYAASLAHGRAPQDAPSPSASAPSRPASSRLHPAQPASQPAASQLPSPPPGVALPVPGAIPVPNDWKSRLGRIARAAVIGTVAATTLVGTIAVVGNSDALFAPITVSRPVVEVPATPQATESSPKSEEAHAASTPSEGAHAASTPSQVAHAASTLSSGSRGVSARGLAQSPSPRPSLAAAVDSPVVAAVSGARVQRLVDDFEQRPDIAAALQARIGEARALVGQQLQHLAPVGLEELIDVQAPLPTGDQAFLHVGRINLPSAGLSRLEREQIPVVVRGTVQPGKVAVTLDVTPESLASPPQGPPGAVYLGSVHTVVRAAAPTVHLDGRIEVTADLDGQATQRALTRWKARQAETPPSSPQRAAIDGNVARLEARRAQVRRLASLAPSKHFLGVLNHALADQGATFSREVVLPSERPLADGIHHLWLGPADAQGRPTLIVTGSLRTPGIDALRLSGDSLVPLPHGETGGLLGEQLNKAIRARVNDEIRAQLVGSAGQLPDLVRAMVASAWNDATTQLQQGAGDALAHAVDAHRGLHVLDAHAEQNQALELNLQSIAPGVGGLGARAAIDIGGVRVTGDAARLLAHPTLLPAAVRNSPATLALSGDALNFALRDLHQGGAVDWRGFLGQVAKQNGLKSLEFNHDDAGRMMSPQLIWKNGQAVLELDLSAQSRGLFPAAPFARGAADTLSRASAAGPPAATVSKLASLPLGDTLPSLPLGGVLDGVGSILVDSIGALLNPFPYVSMHLSIPIQLDVADGVLTLRPATSGVEVSAPRGSSDHIPLPTTILQTIMAQLLVGSGARIGDGMQNVRVPLDLRDRGLSVTAAAAIAPAHEGGAPDLAFGVDPTLPR